MSRFSANLRLPILASFGLAAMFACTVDKAGVTPVIGPSGASTASKAPAAASAQAGAVGTGLAATPAGTTADAAVSGTWVFGSRNEPGPGPVATCAPDQTMSLAQDGTRVVGSVSSCIGICSDLEDLEGTNEAGAVTMDGTYQGNLDEQPITVAYALSYDAASGHLRGTRAGQPFWAAPWVDPGPAVCGVRPSTSAIPLAQ